MRLINTWPTSWPCFESAIAAWRICVMRMRVREYLQPQQKKRKSSFLLIVFASPPIFPRPFFFFFFFFSLHSASVRDMSKETCTSSDPAVLCSAHFSRLSPLMEFSIASYLHSGAVE
ncbi:hypothetical protein M426DRAFT_104224 [Hypoxylon sp. CI-4A]|nr:hypothetical protein M426DRAFT_104224 [Hypoxylon sp. CI-4A]